MPFKFCGGAGRFFDEDVRFDEDAFFFDANLPADGGARFVCDDAGFAIIESSLSSVEEYERLEYGWYCR